MPLPSLDKGDVPVYGICLYMFSAYLLKIFIKTNGCDYVRTDVRTAPRTLRALMREQGIEALLISHAANRYYLSGFELHDVQLNESAGR